MYYAVIGESWDGEKGNLGGGLVENTVEILKAKNRN